MKDTTTRPVLAAMWIGLMAGLVGGLLLIALGGPAPLTASAGALAAGPAWALHLALSALMGVAYALLFPVPRGYATSAVSGMAWGVVWWLLASLAAVWLVTGHLPSRPLGWVPAVVAALFHGALVGLGWHLASGAPARRSGASDRSGPVEVTQRIVILGGGFAGVTAARRLERFFANDAGVSITLVSDVNYMLFTPMLAEIATSVVEPRHIAPPLRSFFRWARVVRGEAEAVDMDRRVLTLAASGPGDQLEIPFDHLVLALGAVPDFYGLPGLRENAFTFKTLPAAIDLRNHVIDMLELADEETEESERRRMLTFVVAGGGFAGSELVGALNDFIRGSLFYYSSIRQQDVSVILVHGSRRILPELSEGLAAYALDKLEARGVTCKCGNRVSAAQPGRVLLSNGETIDAATLVWTAGNTPHPLVGSVPGATLERGAIVTDSTFAVVGLKNVWAMGDCAWIPDAVTGQPALPTAQYALVEAPALALNVYAVIRGRQPRPFHYTSLGSLCLLGHRIAAAEVKGMKFSGMLAWIMWRLVYIYRLPTADRRLRVMMDWIADMFFPPDIVQTYGAPRPAARARGRSPGS